MNPRCTVYKHTSVPLAETVAAAAGAVAIRAEMSSIVHMHATSRQVLLTLVSKTKRLLQICPAVYMYPHTAQWGSPGLLVRALA